MPSAPTRSTERWTAFSPGTGAQFALLPPENATGNFTKVVQRVPVKIRLGRPNDPLLARLRPGLSVEATVETRGADDRAGARTRRRPGRSPLRAGTLRPPAPSPHLQVRPHEPESEKASLRQWLAVAAAILGAFTAILDIQITNSSLSDIEGALGASSDEGSWISTAYLMAEIIVIPLTGWLGSIFGLRRYLAVNTGLFIGFSIACALSTSLPEMILFRAGQGFTGGVLIPTAIRIVRTRLPKSSRRSASRSSA